MKILVVDDHPLVLAAMAQLLLQLERPITMYGASDRDEAYALLAAHPDVALVLLDLALPGMRGLEMLGRLRRDFPRLPVAVLSATHDRATVDGALGAGARGFIAKTASARHVVASVERLLDGRTCPRPELSRMHRGPGGELMFDVLGLTQRQTDVLRLLAQGKPNKLISLLWRFSSLVEGVQCRRLYQPTVPIARAILPQTPRRPLVLQHPGSP